MIITRLIFSLIVFINCFVKLETYQIIKYKSAIESTQSRLKLSEKINYDFVVSIRTYNEVKKYYEAHCSGTLMSELWVLAAGHCVILQTLYAIEAYKINYITYEGPVTKVLLRLRHPEFNNDTFNNDVAVMRLVTPIYKGRNVGFVNLPSAAISTLYLARYLISKGTKNGIMLGWVEYKQQHVLKKISLKLSFIDKCMSYSRTPIDSNLIEYDNICTEPLNNAFLDCVEEDSGGPLMADDGIQYGIMSWGANKANVYTRVDWYLNFIAKATLEFNGRSDLILSKIILIFNLFSIITI